jgi:Asp-tRNA(Asn)/Glu-tRNA(Gln) amidotransferase B subunit
MPPDQVTIDACQKARHEQPGLDFAGLMRTVMVESKGKLNPGFVAKILKEILEKEQQCSV